ncbi:MAG: hypothetical protein Q9208_004376 [Pyrenodesmia sp. 3 TL-2023]
MIPYAHQLRVLDKIYLDTTFALDEDPYRRFPTKASGLRELLTELSAFPKDTVFHFNAWTLGYEDVFVAIAAHLRSQARLNRSVGMLYSSLTSTSCTQSTSTVGAALCGFQFGNKSQAGCLTRDDSVRLHSCEHGTKCSTLEESNKVVWITPLITRSKEGNVPELGAGGGVGDLIQSHELDLGDPEAGPRLIELCRQQIRDPKTLRLTVHLVEDMVYSRKRVVDVSRLSGLETEDAIPLEKLAYLLSEVADQEHSSQHHDELPLQHSSYEEMCHLISALKPRDVYPCVANEESWASGSMVRNLFGHLCSGNRFAHDDEMLLGEDNNRFVPPSYRSPKHASVGNRASPPAQVRVMPETGLDSLGGLPASLRPQSIRAKPLKVTPGSTIPRKREATLRARPRKRTQKEFTGHALENYPVLSSSFSRWVKVSNGSKPIEGFAQDVPGGAGKPDAMTMAGSGGRSDESSSVSTDRSRKGSAGDDTSRPLPIKDTANAVTSIPPHETDVTRPKPCDADDGTQLRPIELSDTSGSETEDNSDDEAEVWRDHIAGEATGHEKQSSASDSIVESHYLGSFDASQT